MGRGDRLHDLVLRVGDQGEEGGIADRGAVFAEDEGGRRAGDAHLIGVYGVVREAWRTGFNERSLFWGGTGFL